MMYVAYIYILMMSKLLGITVVKHDSVSMLLCFLFCVDHIFWMLCVHSWVQSFGHEGLGLLLDILEKLLHKKQ